MIVCECDKCVAKDNTDRQRALDLWNEGEYRVIELDDWDWECGDGCCSDYGTSLTINNYTITKYADLNTILRDVFDFLKLSNIYIIINDDLQEG